MTYNYNATVVRWVDGDTVWLTVDLGFRMTTTNDFRLYGVDTPERGEPGHDEATRRCNELAAPGTVVNITTYKNPDKYGRWLVDITVVDNATVTTVTDVLIEEGLGVSYYGGTRVSETPIREEQ